MRISFIIKTLNEEKKIGQCISSVMQCQDTQDDEIIVVDSASTDRTVEIASNFPVRIIQLVNFLERSCGIGPQLGYQSSSGEFIYLLDGDMTLDKNFLNAALEMMRRDPKIGGIGGIIEEKNLNYTYERYKRYKTPTKSIITVDHLAGGGLFRRSAIEDIGYLTNRNLHGFEELELGLRLTCRGWKLLRLPVTSAHHYGHALSFWRLLAKKWHGRYFEGYGEILRSALGKPFLPRVIGVMKHLIALLLLWILSLCLFIYAPSLVTMGGILLAPVTLFALLALKKRSITNALYSTVEWHIHLMALFIGFFKRPKDPMAQIVAFHIR